jgi:hypothetical protein
MREYIKMDLKGIGWEALTGLIWLRRVTWQNFVKTVMNIASIEDSVS